MVPPVHTLKCVECMRCFNDIVIFALRVLQAYNTKLLRLLGSRQRLKSHHFVSDCVVRFVFDAYYDRFRNGRMACDPFFPALRSTRSGEVMLVHCIRRLHVSSCRLLHQVSVDWQCRLTWRNNADFVKELARQSGLHQQQCGGLLKSFGTKAIRRGVGTECAREQMELLVGQNRSTGRSDSSTTNAVVYADRVSCLFVARNILSACALS